MNYPWNELTETPIPDPFEMEWTVTDKTGEEIPCTVKGFYNSGDFEELQILDEVKNDITNLFLTKAEIQEIESEYNWIYR